MAATLAGRRSHTTIDRSDVHVVLSGIEPLAEKGSMTDSALLSRSPRRHDKDMTATDVEDVFAGVDVESVLPPFAAVTWHPGRNDVTVVDDRLGFRHMYLAAGGGWAGVSSSARALANASAVAIDQAAVAVQSLLGWQLGTRTMFEGVTKQRPGTVAGLRAGHVVVDASDTRPDSLRGDPSLAAAIRSAADLLRTYLGAYLDDHPDAVLQLTGGQDSRVLLSAIPPARRRGMEAMTLAVEGSPDVEIASAIAARCGMVHRVIDLSGLDQLTPDDAHRLVRDAAARLDCAADPLASASISFAEAKLEVRPRLSGLGGEVTRGFYYVGPPRDVAVTRKRVERLARWRMFANEAVPREALRNDFARWADETVIDDIFRAFESYDTDWLSATDRFYLGERMQRWAGVLASATSLERAIVNPMLDDRFLAIAAGLKPRDRQRSRFLSGLSVELDAELATIPMDGRPAPEVYANRSAANYARLGSMTAHKVVGKIRQRAARQLRPPAGGEILAAKVTEYYRQNPDDLNAVRALDLFRAEWLDGFLDGAHAVPESAVALLVNLEVATSTAT